MSVWSGIAAAGVAIALAFVAVGQPLWEWRLEDSQQAEVWSYGPLDAHHYVINKTSGLIAPDRDYDYGQLATQPNMFKVFGEFEQLFIIGPLAHRFVEEAVPEKDGGDDQAYPVGDEPATASRARPIGPGAGDRRSLRHRVEQPAGQAHVAQPDERQRSRCGRQHDLRDL